MIESCGQLTFCGIAIRISEEHPEHLPPAEVHSDEWLPLEYLGFLAEPHRVVGNALVTRCFVQASPQEQMDAPDTSGAESLTSQAVVEIRDHLLCQVRERHTSDAGDDVAVNQIAVPALGVAVPFVPIGGEPPAAPLPDCHIIFLHVIASFWQTNNITESRK